MTHPNQPQNALCNQWIQRRKIYKIDPRSSLREYLSDPDSDWTDVDVVQYYLGCLLGLLPLYEEGETITEHWNKYKNIFQSDNPLNNILYDTLMALTKVGLLKCRPNDGISKAHSFRFVKNPPAAT